MPKYPLAHILPAFLHQAQPAMGGVADDDFSLDVIC
jgi:hypothetical protein